MHGHHFDDRYDDYHHRYDDGPHELDEDEADGGDEDGGGPELPVISEDSHLGGSA